LEPGRSVKNTDQEIKKNESPGSLPDFEQVIGPSRAFLFDWSEIWRYRELFYFFTWRDIKIKYKQTLLGFLWAVLQPTLMMVVLTLFFGRVLSIPSQNIPYPLYIFSGLLMWQVFSSGLTNASNSMINNSTIIKKIYFPRVVIPVSSILASLFDFLMAMLPFMGLLLYYRHPVLPDAIWMWPLALLLSVLATLGVGCWLAALNVKYRDFRYVIPFLVQVLFFLTPVIYPITLLKYPLLQYILISSPIYASVELFRYPLTGHIPDMTFVLISVVSSILFLGLGLTYFRRTEDFFADLT
jgi:lipopolysaccharide transport system permease protein